MRRRVATAVTALVAVLAATLSLAWIVPLPERLATPGSPTLRYADGTVAHVYLAPDGRWRVPARLDQVDPAYLDALTAYEDQRFWWHPGVDPVAIVRAALSDLRAGAVVSGGSTITMQLVRIVEPRPRTLASKIVEGVRAAQLELRMSKPEILEAYLTFAPYGRNVEGVETASLAYFGHTAERLEPSEIAVLLAVPQDPTHRWPRPDHAAALAAARDRVATRIGLVDATRADVPVESHAMPREAAHLAAWLAGRARREGDVVTHLDRGVQGIAERILASERARFDDEGIHNGAIVVIEHATGNVVGLVGGFDFWDAEHGGQIAAFDEPRSPGSALKPFIYATAIDGALVLPDQLVEDVPMRWGSYAPENFDGRFSGVVRAEDALSRSLNLPFIALLARVGVEPLLGELRRLGAHHLDERPGHYGLSVAAGGIELTPLEMTGLYAALAEDGVPRPPIVIGAAPESGPAAFSSGAAFLTRRALSLRDRPDFPTRRVVGGLSPAIHWKTGTSYGWRDAWALGSGATYTVGVWLGNLDGAGSQHLIGGEAAGPLLFDVLEALGELGRDASARPPPDLAPVEVCALSGRVPGPSCPERKYVLARTERTPTEPCPYHQSIELDDASGLRVGPACRAGRSTHTETTVVWPANVRRWLEGRATDGPPAWVPGCAVDAGRVTIVSPGEGRDVVLIPGVSPTDQEVPLEADGDGTLTWFVDGALVGAAVAGERVWWTPSEGEHAVAVMDDAGTTAKRNLRVRRATR